MNGRMTLKNFFYFLDLDLSLLDVCSTDFFIFFFYGRAIDPIDVPRVFFYFFTRLDVVHG